MPEGHELCLGKLERLDDMPPGDNAHVAGERGINRCRNPGCCEFGDDVERLAARANWTGGIRTIHSLNVPHASPTRGTQSRQRLGTKQRRRDELVRIWDIGSLCRQVEDGAGVDDEPSHRAPQIGVGASQH